MTTKARKPVDERQIQAGKRLREKREAAAIPKALMAYLLEVDPKTIDNYENGVTEASGAVKFAYNNIDLVREQAGLPIRPSSCSAGYWVELPKLFDDSYLVNGYQAHQGEAAGSLELLRKAS